MGNKIHQLRIPLAECGWEQGVGALLQERGIPVDRLHHGLCHCGKDREALLRRGADSLDLYRGGGDDEVRLMRWIDWGVEVPQGKLPEPFPFPQRRKCRRPGSRIGVL